MYICDVHGVLNCEWCDECQKIVECDCSTTEKTRFKDLIYDSQTGEHTVTIWIEFCPVCGELVSCYT